MKTASLNVDYNFNYFIALVRSVLNETEPELPSQNVDWNMIYSIAAAHSMAAVLRCAVEKLPKEKKPPENITAFLNQLYGEQMVTDINLTVETERISNLLDSVGICSMPFKGIVTKKDYPASCLRSMSDVDILYRPENRAEVERIMLSEGYTKESIGVKDTSFRKDGILHFEMHTSLLEEESPAYSYFLDIWSRAVFSSNNKACMNIDDTYIFMLEHLANHLIFGGAGVRMYCDIYLFLKKHSEDINREYVNKILKSILLSEFEKETVSLCNSWFSPGADPDLNTDIAEFVLNSATFGRVSVHFASEVLRKKAEITNSATINGVFRIIIKLFPTVKRMKLYYKAVDKLPVLYPVFLLVFWIDRAFVKRNIRTKNIGAYFISDDSDAIKELKSIYAKLGLNKRL